MKPLKSPTLYSRLALTTSITLVVGYFVVYAAWTSISDVTGWQTLTATLINNILGNLTDLNGRTTTLEWAIAGASVWSKVGSDINYTAGKVGIGTTTPAASLDVKRTAADSQFAGWIEGSDINNYGLWVNIANTTSSKAITDFKSGNISRLFVRADGNVGIGTNSPVNKLDVNWYASATRLIAGNNVIIAANSIAIGDGASTTAGGQIRSIEDGSTLGLRFMNYAANTEWMRIQNGNVGIGTASPGTYKLYVNDAGSNALALNAPINPVQRFLVWWAQIWGFIGNYVAPNGLSVYNYNNNSIAMQFTSDSKVWIWTTTPGDTLTVNGGVTANAFTSATGWSSITAASGWTSLAYCRKIWSFLQIKGQIYYTAWDIIPTWGGTAVATLPAECRPSAAIQYPPWACWNNAATTVFPCFMQIDSTVGGVFLYSTSMASFRYFSFAGTFPAN